MGFEYPKFQRDIDAKNKADATIRRQANLFIFLLCLIASVVIIYYWQNLNAWIENLKPTPAKLVAIKKQIPPVPAIVRPITPPNTEPAKINPPFYKCISRDRKITYQQNACTE
jgi:hypothetical protein